MKDTSAFLKFVEDGVVKEKSLQRVRIVHYTYMAALCSCYSALASINLGLVIDVKNIDLQIKNTKKHVF